jgi:hypothetical protein
VTVAWGNWIEHAHWCAARWATVNGVPAHVLEVPDDASAVYQRARVFERFEHADLICYFDADTWAERPMLAELPSTESLGLVRDPGWRAVRKVEPTELWARYVNSGMFLARNVAEVRALFRLWWDLRHFRTGYHTDQSALNHLLRVTRFHWFDLPQTCNWLTRVSPVRDPPDDVKLWHFAGPDRTGGPDEYSDVRQELRRIQTIGRVTDPGAQKREP